jgi:hypothetical protein
MIQWIKETFFHDDEAEQLLEANARLQRELEAHKAAYASELTFYHREIKRLHGEIGQLLNGMEVKG